MCFQSFSRKRNIDTLVTVTVTRPRAEPQDQEQSHKTKIKTEFCWSETGLVTRPKSQTTSLYI